MPTPGSLSSQMRPPISSTSRRQIVSPRPVPPCLRVVDMSACVNGWNSFADCSGVMPMPVSRTENLSCTFSPVRSSSSMSSRISPRSVNFTALLTRLVRIWPRRSGSPSRCSGIAGRDVRQELEPLVVRLLRGQRRDRADDVVEPEVGGLDVELAGLDLREVEDVVDDRQQRRAGVVDLARRSRAASAMSGVLRARCDRPMMAFIGVRISWLMFARNIDFISVASSAFRLAPTSSAACVLELTRLLLRLPEQLLGAQVALQDLQAHGDDRQQLVEQRLLPRGERRGRTPLRARRAACRWTAPAAPSPAAGAAWPRPEAMRR